MSVPRGPLRVVLIRSGGYDYGELELDAPVHLVAGNNVGKTTLVAALQFLYIDNGPEMYFSHPWPETRQHYFPVVGSAVLFECMTPTGFQVVGLHGLGPVRGFEYERFAYDGHYLRDDYVDGQRVRPWDEVVRRLVARGLRIPLDAQQLRTSLVGGRDASAPGLGIVPLARAGSYDNFKFLFRNLLRLARIDQEHLKLLFIDIALPRLRREGIDLRRDHAATFDQVQRQAHDVAALKLVAPEIRDLVETHDRRDRLRGVLVATWRALDRELEALREATARGVAEVDADKASLTADRERVALREADLLERVRDVHERRGGTEAEIRAIHRLRDASRTIDPTFEARARHEHDRRLDGLAARVAVATTANRADVERQLAAVRRTLDVDSALVARFEDAVVTWLRTRSGLSDDQIEDAFRILDPAILERLVVPDGVRVTDPAALAASLADLAQGFDANGWAGAGVELPRSQLRTGSVLSDLADVSVVVARRERDRRMEATLASTLSDVDAREALQVELGGVRAARDAAMARLVQWKAYVDRQPELEQLERDRDELGDQASGLEATLKGLRDEVTAITNQERDVADRRRRLIDTLDREAAAVRALSPPAPGWPEGTVPQAALLELVSAYQDASADQQEAEVHFRRLMASVEARTAGRHVGASEAETLARLADELAALADSERDVETLWRHLVEGIRSSFKALIDGVDEVRTQVSRLTQALGRRRVSNLGGIELELVRQEELLSRLRGVVDRDAAPLFATPDGGARAVQEVAAWLKDRPRIELSELFNLRIRVTDRDGRIKTFDSLAQIESMGTSTTIKVLVHIELLKTMMTDEPVSIPFFLDEVGLIDEDNLRAIVAQAHGMGFVPVLASPDARDTVDTLYFLRPPTSGGLILDERSRIVLEREASGGS